MTQSGRNISRQLAEILFDDLDTEKTGVLNLENMKKLYNDLKNDLKEIVRDKLRKFVIDRQKFQINKDEFIELFPKNSTPCIHINLSEVKEVQRIQELSHSELQNVLNKRLETRPASVVKPKFIKKSNNFSKSVSRQASQDASSKNKASIFVRKSYFSSLL